MTGRHRTGTTERVVFEVRDRYNNPVSGVEVTATATGAGGTLTAVNTVSDENGHVVFEYTADDSGDAQIQATFGPSDLETATVDVTAVRLSADGGGGGGCALRDWSATNTTQTLTGANEGCTWSGLARVSSLSLSAPAFVPLEGHRDEVVTGSEFFRMTFTVTDGSTTYLVTLGDQTDGFEREFGGKWSNPGVTVYRRTGDTAYTTVGSHDVATATLESWYDGTSSLDILDSSSYAKRPTGAITELKNFVRQNRVDVRFVEIDGSVTVDAN